MVNVGASARLDAALPRVDARMCIGMWRVCIGIRRGVQRWVVYAGVGAEMCAGWCRGMQGCAVLVLGARIPGPVAKQQKPTHTEQNISDE